MQNKINTMMKYLYSATMRERKRETDINSSDFNIM